ncbi:hypothetical protein [Xanthomonas theicola]|uniref:hypothetical protein n=1 Tax=Xanthomonas theicola TaxID=56464 RepID=UPI001304CC3C|nr:hypothetical protein [Xanthomonas theicola]QNH23499.1 hypothetical protein G4Q83_18545 [Xanthomonas theicola]
MSFLFRRKSLDLVTVHEAGRRLLLTLIWSAFVRQAALAALDRADTPVRIARGRKRRRAAPRLSPARGRTPLSDSAIPARGP